MGSVSPFMSGLVSEEVRRVVAEAAKSGRMLSASDTAATILKTYPRCGFNEAEIANEVILKAARAGVAVEIGRQRSLQARLTLVERKAPEAPRHLS